MGVGIRKITNLPMSYRLAVRRIASNRGTMTRIRERFESRTRERSQPPPLLPLNGRRNRIVAKARRLVDLQAASIWRDLRGELRGAHGDVLDVGAGAQPYRTLLHGQARYKAIDIGEAEA